jgi:hypothetical protein
MTRIKANDFLVGIFSRPFASFAGFSLRHYFDIRRSCFVINKFVFIRVSFACHAVATLPPLVPEAYIALRGSLKILVWYLRRRVVESTPW